MIGAVRSELLRAVSGRVLLAMLALALMMPAITLSAGGGADDLAALGSADATRRLIETLGWSFVAAAFGGAYTVTREDYWRSLDRTVVAVSFRCAFGAKVIAGSLFGVGLGIFGTAGWIGIAAVLLGRAGLVLDLAAVAPATIAGALLGSALGGISGAAVGWMVRNYYVAAALVLAVPVALERGLAGVAPDVARYLPGRALAALAGPVSQGEVLPVAAGLGVSAAWTAVLLAAAYVLARRRFR